MERIQVEWPHIKILMTFLFGKHTLAINTVWPGLIFKFADESKNPISYLIVQMFASVCVYVSVLRNACAVSTERKAKQQWEQEVSWVPYGKDD